MIAPVVETRLYACVAAKCRELGCEPLAIGGIADHLHLLVRYPATLEIAKLIKDVKGATSFLMSRQLTPDVSFKWQSGYGAFTVAKRDVPTIVAYINNQKEHHKRNTLLDELEIYEGEAQSPKETLQM